MSRPPRRTTESAVVGSRQRRAKPIAALLTWREDMRWAWGIFGNILTTSCTHSPLCGRPDNSLCGLLPVPLVMIIDHEDLKNYQFIQIIRKALTRLRTEKRKLVAPALTSCPRAEPSFAMFTVTVTNWGRDLSSQLDCDIL